MFQFSTRGSEGGAPPPPPPTTTPPDPGKFFKYSSYQVLKNSYFGWIFTCNFEHYNYTESKIIVVVQYVTKRMIMKFVAK